MATRNDKETIAFEELASGDFAKKVSNATGLDSTNDEVDTRHRGQGSRITTATTTVCGSGPGTFHVLNVKATLTGAVTIYDNTAGSGTIIDVLPIGLAVGTYFYDVDFVTGLTVVTAAADNIWLGFKLDD